jgi:acyl-CoA synthetase (AMP-forming)/AMP-acid ligase II
MVSHRNLLTNLEAIRRGFKMEVDEIGSANSRGVFWLPAYHDMGLIGGILTPLYVGGDVATIVPAAPVALVVGNLAHPVEHQRCAKLRLRLVRREDHARPTRRT